MSLRTTRPHASRRGSTTPRVTLQFGQELTLGTGGCSLQPCPQPSPFQVQKHGNTAGQGHVRGSDTAFGCHFVTHTPASSPRSVSARSGQAHPGPGASSPSRWKRGCSAAPAAPQACGTGTLRSSPEVSAPPASPPAARLAASSFLLFFTWCRWDLDRV